MNIFKKLLKNTFIYRFFNTNFLMLSNRINVIDDKILLLEESQKRLEDIGNNSAILLNNNVTSISNDLQKLNNIVNSIDIKTKQFEYINTELFLLSNTASKQKILIVGFYGAPNSGDELMLQSILEKIDTLQYSITIMLSDNPNYKLEGYKNINFIHYPKTNMDINIIANYFDKIIFGGGAIIDDKNYNKDNSYQYDVARILIDLSISSILKNKKIYCVGLSSSKTLTNYAYISNLDFIIKNCSHFSLRDPISYKTLESSGISNESLNKIDIIDDLVFSLKHVDYVLPDSAQINIGLILIGFSDHTKLIQIINWIDEYFVNKKITVNLNLIPFYDFCHSDIYNFEQILDKLNIKSNIIIQPYKQTYSDIAEIFCKCNMIINMRYHSSLLCLKFGIPSIQILYDIHPHYNNKMTYLKNKYSLDNLFLSYTTLEKTSLFNTLNYAFENSKQISLSEKTISKDIENSAQEQHLNIINKILEN